MKTDNPNIKSRAEIIPQGRIYRAEDKTLRKWFSESDPGAKTPAAENPSTDAKNLFEFESYSTRADQRGKGRLVLHFYDVDTGEMMPAFFNANIHYQRGPMAGQNFKIGRNCRFWVYPRSKFALFWLDTFGGVGKWSIVYRQLNRIKRIRFSGEVKRSEKYKQIINLKRVRL